MALSSACLFRVLSQFRGELATVEAERPDADPPPPDADVAGLDVALADPGPCLALRAFGAKVVWLQFHLSQTMTEPYSG